jgi:hypothetical protein
MEPRFDCNLLELIIAWLGKVLSEMKTRLDLASGDFKKTSDQTGENDERNYFGKNIFLNLSWHRAIV